MAMLNPIYLDSTIFIDSQLLSKTFKVVENRLVNRMLRYQRWVVCRWTGPSLSEYMQPVSSRKRKTKKTNKCLLEVYKQARKRYVR